MSDDKFRDRVDLRRRMRHEAFAQAARRAKREDRRIVVWIRPEPDQDVWYVRSWEEGRPAGAKLAGEVDQDGDIRDVHLGFTGTY